MGGGLGRLHRPRGFVFLFFFFLTPAQEPARNVCLSQLDVILTCALAHCFQHPKPLQLMSCSFSIMFLLFRTEGCYFCTYIHQVFFFSFSLSLPLVLTIQTRCATETVPSPLATSQRAILVLAVPSSSRINAAAALITSRLSTVD